MSHLSHESLARLVDEPPTALEAAHLAECEACRAGRDAMQADARALGSLGDLAPPVHAWAELEQRLAAEGLVRRERRGIPVALLRLAAALALFLTGTLAGFAWRSSTLPPPQTVAAVPAERAGSNEDAPAVDSPAAGTTARVADATTTQPADEPALDAVATRPAGDVVAVAEREPAPAPAQREPRIIGPAPSDPRYASLPEFSPRTAQEAALLLREAEGAYLDALAHYAQLAGAAQESGDPLARLAALEGIVLTTREALGRAPADPIINGYHMTALAQREATLRQIAATSRNPWF